MGLKERLRRKEASRATQTLYERFGVHGNPFPRANETSGHPRHETPADDRIVDNILEFRDTGSSRVLVIVGTQGVGKTNLLGYYEQQLRQLHLGESGFHIIRHLADPEPSFDALVRGILQELGVGYVERVVGALQRLRSEQQEAALEQVRTSDLRRLLRATMVLTDERRWTWALEWLLGQRVLKRHREQLSVYFRLDTVESKTQVLRDLVVLGAETGELKGVYLLLDELEKQAGVLPRSKVVRYLFALRALIDALPRHLFLMLAISPDAFAHYKSLVPAIAGRLPEGNQVTLQPIKSAEEALEYYRFYLDAARVAASQAGRGPAGSHPLMTEQEVASLYSELEAEADEAGAPGVLQRQFLDRLHLAVRERLASS